MLSLVFPGGPFMFWPVFAAFFGIMSVVAFVVCLVDKRRARRGLGRVREQTLLLLALLGGSVGLLLGMVLVRHKVSKPSFLARMLVVVVLQLVVTWALLGQFSQ